MAAIMTTTVPRSILYNIHPSLLNDTAPMSTSWENTTLPVLDEYSDDPILRLLKIFIIILFTSTTIIGSLGNILVIVVVYSNKKMRNSTNMLIISLAVADLFFIVICVPFTAVTLIAPHWPFGDVFCKIYQHMINVTCYASVYTLVLMSLDRFLAVVYPITSMNIRTTNNALYLIFILWLTIIVATLPIVFESGVLTIQGEDYCVIINIVEDDIFRQSSYHGRLFYGCFFIFGYLLPLLLIIVLYGVMLRSLIQRRAGTQSEESMRSKKRVTKMIIVVVAIFAICWLPTHVRFLIQYFFVYPEGIAMYFFQTFATCLAYMNSCMNPILYAFLSENFRKSFRKLICSYCTSYVSCGENTTRENIDFERTTVPSRNGKHKNGVIGSERLHLNGNSTTTHV